VNPGEDFGFFSCRKVNTRDSVSSGGDIVEHKTIVLKHLFTTLYGKEAIEISIQLSVNALILKPAL
jgi:hypothetical protein